ncbi:hypothetical protein ACQWFV_25025, partial [Salmonella enterica subsp. enterica serovar Infantis]
HVIIFHLVNDQIEMDNIFIVLRALCYIAHVYMNVICPHNKLRRFFCLLLRAAFIVLHGDTNIKTVLLK